MVGRLALMIAVTLGVLLVPFVFGTGASWLLTLVLATFAAGISSVWSASYYWHVQRLRLAEKQRLINVIVHTSSSHEDLIWAVHQRLAMLEEERKASTRPELRLSLGWLIGAMASHEFIGRILGGEVGEEALAQLRYEHRLRIAECTSDHEILRRLRCRHALLLAVTVLGIVWDRLKHVGSRATSINKSDD